MCSQEEDWARGEVRAALFFLILRCCLPAELC